MIALALTSSPDDVELLFIGGGTISFYGSLTLAFELLAAVLFNAATTTGFFDSKN